MKYFIAAKRQTIWIVTGHNFLVYEFLVSDISSTHIA